MERGSIKSLSYRVAVNEVLLRQRHELASLHEDGALNISDGGKSPAAAAATLVLDGCHGALGAPVNAVVGGAKAGQSGIGALALEGAAGLEAELLGAELVLREISEFVDAVAAKELYEWERQGGRASEALTWRWGPVG